MLAFAMIVLPLLVGKFMKDREIAQRNICINNLRQIEAAKDQLGLESGRDWTKWRWESDEQAFSMIVNRGTGYMKYFPLCPTSTTDTENAAQSAADYDVNPIGITAVCTVDKTHCFP